MACKRFIFFFYVEQSCLFIMNNQIIKHTEQCKVYKQIALLKLKLLIVNVEEKWRDQLAQNF